MAQDKMGNPEPQAKNNENQTLRISC